MTRISAQASAPSSPTTGDYWVETDVTPHAFTRWSGSTWVQVGAAGSSSADSIDAVDAVVTHGADNTGTTNTHVALQAAIDAASTAKTVLYIPPGSYRVGATLNIKTNTRISAYGAKLLCYYTSLGDAGTMAPVVECMNVSDVIIEGLEIDGRQSSWAHTEWKPGINISDSDRILVRDVYSHDNKGDGISISTMTPNLHNNDITVDNGRFDTNYRGGIFLGEGKNVRITNCTGRYNTGTSPMFGMDIEPDGDQSIVEDVVVSGCTFSNNGTEDTDGSGFYITVRDKTTGFTATAGTTTTVTVGSAVTANQYRNCILRWLTGNNAGEEQIITSHTTTVFTLAEATSSATANTDTFEILPRQHNFVIENNHIEYNGIQGVIFYHSRDVVFRNNWSTQNGSRGLEIRGRSENLLIEGNTITRNDGDCVMFGSGSNRTMTNVRFLNNYLRGRLDGGDGVEIDTGDTVTGLTMAGNDIGDVATGFKVVGTLAELRWLNNYIHDVSTAAVSGLTPAMISNAKALEYVIDGGGSAITTGVKGYVKMPSAGFIIGHEVTLDQSGSIVIDVWKDTYTNYPPVDADSITASAPPTISAATKAQDFTLTGWTRLFAAGDYLGFNVDSITTATRATLALMYVEV